MVCLIREEITFSNNTPIETDTIEWQSIAILLTALILFTSSLDNHVD